MFQVLHHKREPVNLVQVGNVTGLADIRTMLVQGGWTYVDEQDGGILAATVFPDAKQAEDAMHLFRLPPWIESRDLTNLEITCCRL